LVKREEHFAQPTVHLLMKSVIIIGAGIAGLAAAVRLAKVGFEVTVFEASDGPGGKLRERQMGEYRFDLGPSLFTLPHNVDELFELCGERPADHFRYTRLKTLCHYFWNDGTTFQASGDEEELIRTFELHFGEDPEAVRKYLRRAAFVYERTAPVFLHQSLRHLRWFSKEVRRGLAAIPRLPLFGTMHSSNASTFRNPKTIQYFNRYATYNGSNPYDAPAMMMLIPHLEHGLGAFLPKGGMGEISKSIYELALRQGVKFRFNTSVEKIIHRDKRVKGIRTSEEEFMADYVVSNMDMHPTYRRLLSDLKEPKKLLAQEKSSSALIFYWGIRKSFPELDVHNIFFSDEYREEFDSIFRTHSLQIDPTIYINITSKIERGDAPSNGENWFIMINISHHTGQDWEAIRTAARALILAKLSRILAVKLEELIEEEDFLDPVTIESRTSSHLGALYGNASNSPYAAFLRHSNQSTSLGGLYFCGGSVHPGGGIPLCLFGAKITAELIAQNHP